MKPATRTWRLGWPLPALLSWAAAWALALALGQAQAPVWASLGLPTALGVALALWPAVAATPWRRVFVASGFPVSLLAMGQGGALPAWLWLAPLLLLWLAYPRHAWQDAPVFPTPAGALRELPAHLPDLAQRPNTRLLDAGCGMGDGLRELHAAFPAAQVDGVEWSRLWWAVAAWRCPWARVRCGDMWADDWSTCDLVYLFQRPESMPRAMDKAQREMRAGSCLVSLEFEARDAQGHAWLAQARIPLEGDRSLWVYRMRAHKAAEPTTLRD